MSWKHLHLWRMAFRNMLVHKQTTLLTILGALVGTALITTSLLLQHSMNHSVDQVIAKQIGNIAVDVSALEQKKLQQGYFTDAHVREMKEEIKQQGRNLLPTVAMETLFMVKDPSGKPLLVGPKTYVYGFAPVLGKQFDEKAMGLLPGQIKSNEVILSLPLAEQLDVKANDQIYIQDKRNQLQPFVVRAIVPEQGLTGYKGIQQSRYTAIVSLDQARQLAQMKQGYSNVLISTNQDIQENGIVLDYKKWTENSVRWKIRSDLEHNLKMLPVFTIASLNAIVIGMVLIINIFKMIGEERRREMGILRAIGLTSEDLARVLRIEGILYAVISSVLGTVAGIGLSYLLMLKLQDLLQVIAEYEQGIMMKFTFDVNLGTLMTGFSIGALLVYGCVWFVSRKVTRLQIVEAIYGQENVTKVTPTKNKSILFKAFQLFLFIFSVFLYLVTMTESYRNYVSDSPIQPVLNFLMGFILVILTVLICVMWMGKIINIITGLFRPFPRMYGMFKLAFRYPEVNKTRSGLILLMFSLVLFLTGFSGVFSKTMVQYFGNFDARKATAGYDLLAIHSGKMTTGELQKIMNQSHYIDKGKIQQGVAVQQIPIGDINDFYINEIDEAFSSHTTLTLKSRDRSYHDDRSAWMAIAKDPNVVILSSHLPNLNGETYEVGDLYPVEAFGRIEKKKIIGIADYSNESYGYPTSYGLWVKQNDISQYAVDDKQIQTTVLIQGKNNGISKEVIKGIEKEFTLHNIYPLVNPTENFLVHNSFIQVLFSLFEGFSALATFIGIAGLMVVMLRVIRERRQQIGMMRAIGVQGELIYWSILFEGISLGLTGILLGMGLGSYTGYMMISSLMKDGGGNVAILVPYGKLALYLIGSLLFTILASMIPARKAVKLPPAEATRYIG